jgi:hypothetical protein
MDEPSMTGTGAAASGRVIGRREAVRILAAGAAGLLAASLPGCLLDGDRRREVLALKLLEDKYGREFEITFKAYGWGRSNQPVAYCRALEDDDLFFRMKFNVEGRRIMRDTFVGRRLGRQLEGVIAECFAAQGIRAASHAIVYTDFLGPDKAEETDPDVSLDGFIARYGPYQVHAYVFITDEVDDLRASPEFAEAVSAVYAEAQPSSRLWVYIIKSENLDAYSERIRQAVQFEGRGSLEGRPFDGFLVKAYEQTLEITEDVFWRYF